MKGNVSVVIPNWNGADMLEECLKSLEKQTCAHEVIVVDNGSEDGSVEFVERNFSKARLIKNFRNLGFAGGVNKGLKQALGVGAKYVAVLNNDTVLDKNWLKELVLEMERDPKCAIVASRVIKTGDGLLDNTGEELSIWGLPFPRSRDQAVDKDNSPTEVFGASGGSTLYSAELFKQVGLFDEDFFAYYEDADLNLRARLGGFTARYARNAVVHHKVGGTSARVSGFTTYQTLKNLPWLIIKNIPTGLLVKSLPRFAILYGLIFTKALLSRHFFTALKALLVSLFYLPKKFWQRHKIQSRRKVSAKHLGKLFYAGLPPNSRLHRFFSRRRSQQKTGH